MKKNQLIALLLALTMLLTMLSACGKSETSSEPPKTNTPEEPVDTIVSEKFGPIYDEWSEMTDEELYALAKDEVAKNGPINIYATSFSPLFLSSKR